MKSATQVFDEFMSDPENREWFATRPKTVQLLIERMPWETFIVKPDAPTGKSIACPGQKVHLLCYASCAHCGEAYMKVVVKGSEKTELAKRNETLSFAVKGFIDGFFSKHEIIEENEPVIPSKLTLEEVLAANVIVKVDPEWLEPIE